MSYAVISDVHSNLESLQSVLGDIKKRHITDIYFLGDAVGYGPEPNECIEILKKECKILLAGNHDWGVAGILDTGFFNKNAKAAIEWTKQFITNKNVKTLKSFPVKSELISANITLVHSTPYEPEQWHYLLKLIDAEINFQHFDTNFCYIGHSHRPFIIEKLPSGEMATNKKSTLIKPVCRYIINAGSVGQPRDSDPRASYVVADDENIEIARVSYDIKAVQGKMMNAGLPLPLIERLSSGM